MANSKTSTVNKTCFVTMLAREYARLDKLLLLYDDDAKPAYADDPLWESRQEDLFQQMQLIRTLASYSVPEDAEGWGFFGELMNIGVGKRYGFVLGTVSDYLQSLSAEAAAERPAAA